MRTESSFSLPQKSSPDKSADYLDLPVHHAGRPADHVCRGRGPYGACDWLPRCGCAAALPGSVHSGVDGGRRLQHVPVFYPGDGHLPVQVHAQSLARRLGCARDHRGPNNCGCYRLLWQRRSVSHLFGCRWVSPGGGYSRGLLNPRGYGSQMVIISTCCGLLGLVLNFWCFSSPFSCPDSCAVSGKEKQF